MVPALYDRPTDAGWSSSVARWAHNPEVVGSNPAPATSTKIKALALRLRGGSLLCGIP